MILSTRQRNMVHIYRIIRKNNKCKITRSELGHFLEINNFEPEALYDKYYISPIDKSNVERMLTYLGKRTKNEQHRSREVNPDELSAYDRSVFEALKAGVSVPEIKLSLDYDDHQEFLQSLSDHNLINLIEKGFCHEPDVQRDQH